MTFLLVCVAIIGAVVLVYGLHRVALWAEDRGWIYYRKGRGSSGAGARATLELQSFLEPSVRHVVEERQYGEVGRADDKASSDT